MPSPTVFLSSTFRDDFGDGQADVPLRRRIIEAETKLAVNVWAWEKQGSIPNGPAPDSDTIIDRCFGGIRDSDLFVFIVTGRHGSGADLLDGRVTASYLELELFAAALLAKPILVLQYRNREAEPLLKDAMEVLRHSFGSAAYLTGDENDLFDHFQSVCGALVDNGPERAGLCAEHVLPEGLSLRRSQPRLEEDLSNPALLFLDGRWRSREPGGDLDKARLLLDQVAAGTRTIGGETKILPHGAAMFRLWAAMREIQDGEGAHSGDPQLASLWDRALGLWARHASWFGLHGHTWMGPLAAINSQVALRRRMAREPHFHTDPQLRAPFSSRASALYSIAQRMRTRRRKLFHYRQVMKLTSEAMQLDAQERSAAMSVRAHALVQMARLGQFWKVWEAKVEFEHVLRLRQTTGASESSIGEVKADLGLVLVHVGQRSKGFGLLQEGVALLRTERSPSGQAALALGLRKLALAAQHAGRRELERAARNELAAIAEQVEAIDQLRKDQQDNLAEFRPAKAERYDATGKP